MFLTDGANNVSNQFTNGPPGTQVNFDWLNAIQNELAAVIAAASITLDKTNSAQLLAALRAMFVRPGTTSTFTAAQTFSAGASITGGSRVVPSKATGADSSSGTEKLGYWIDAEGNLTVSGLIVSLSGTPAVFWAAGTIPAQFRPPGAFARAYLCQGGGGKVGVVSVMPDGSASVINMDGTGATAAEMHFTVLANAYTSYVP